VEDLLFNTRIEQRSWPPSIGAFKLWCRAKNATNQWSLRINFAAHFAEMGAAEWGNLTFSDTPFDKFIKWKCPKKSGYPTCLEEPNWYIGLTASHGDAPDR
jgi:hypothetical protein